MQERLLRYKAAKHNVPEKVAAIAGPRGMSTIIDANKSFEASVASVTRSGVSSNNKETDHELVNSLKSSKMTE